MFTLRLETFSALTNRLGHVSDNHKNSHFKQSICLLLKEAQRTVLWCPTAAPWHLETISLSMFWGQRWQMRECLTTGHNHRFKSICMMMRISRSSWKHNKPRINISLNSAMMSKTCQFLNCSKESYTIWNKSTNMQIPLLQNNRSYAWYQMDFSFIWLII